MRLISAQFVGQSVFMPRRMDDSAASGRPAFFAYGTRVVKVPDVGKLFFNPQGCEASAGTGQVTAQTSESFGSKSVFTTRR